MTSELKAGIFVLSAIAVLIYMSTKLTQNQYSFSGTKRYYSVIQDATGLLQKSKVKMAGLDIGQLSNMELTGKKARITVEITASLVLHKDATVATKSLGFLGDKYLELFPGSDDQPILEEGGMIKEGFSSGSLDQLTQKTSQLVDNLKDITDILKESLKGSGEGTDGTRLDRILDNMEQFSEGLAEMDKLGDLADQLTSIAGNVREVTEKVSRGEGTVGKLLNDTETIDRLNQTLSGVNKFVTKAEKLQVLIDAKSAALTSIGGSRTHFSLMFQPTYDKYYLFGISVRPQGVTDVTKTYTTNSPDQPGATTSVKEEKVVDDSKVGINLQFAKRFGDAVFRIGLFETTGGLAVDYHFWEDRIKLFTELYRFKRGDAPQLNAGVEVSIYKPFYLWSGGDYMLSRENRSFFIGGGIRFNDQDIKALVAAAAGSSLR